MMYNYCSTVQKDCQGDFYENQAYWREKNHYEQSNGQI